MKSNILIVLFLFFSATTVMADAADDILKAVDTGKDTFIQENKTNDQSKETYDQESEEGKDVITKEQYRKIQEEHRFYMIIGLIVVTPFFLLILLYFIKCSTDYTEHAIIHGSGLVLVIQATTMIVIASPTTEQLTAAIGVLAAIAGYLFGTARKGKEQ